MASLYALSDCSGRAFLLPVSAFPSVAFSASPFPLVLQELTEESQVEFTEYDDGGRDTALQNGGVGIKRWMLFYDGLTLTQATTLDDHALLARVNADGLSAYTFSFTDRAASPVTHTGVRYQSYERGRYTNKNNQSRTIILARFP